MEVAKVFKKIYENPLTWPKLLQVDGGREFMGETSRLMQENNVTIRSQYAVESIPSNPKLIRAWVKHLPKPSAWKEWNLYQALAYAKKRGESCPEKTGRINDQEVFSGLARFISGSISQL
ncbi:6492_t:CDS:2 [Entrophospora sp. SA101]|nr:6515_t:CDS:2 [Entrophospora sp. SA101]CAJ0745098.1 2676_t:CDS:2 [Entrophospora sp. SA101]CAJ0747455.1 8511_t:CDS:2 [Entrophospora sp. SA101]CAJ0750954.1 6492_t:CDS:2 [Entrophospora sp. SA101]